MGWDREPLALIGVALLTTAAAALTGACDRTPAIIMSQHESPAPRPVLLPPDVRARLERRFDVTAVEQLLGTMTPDEQHAFLESLGATGAAPAGGETRDVSILMRSTDPARQALIDKMWAPFWDHLPPELLDRTDLPYPGRELAKARRAARESARDTGKDP